MSGELTTGHVAAAGLGSIAAGLFGDAYVTAIESMGGTPTDNLVTALAQIPATGLSSDPMALAVGAACACAPWLAFARYLIRAGSYRNGEEHGSSRWGTVKEGRAFMDARDPPEQHTLQPRLRPGAQAREV